MADVVLTNTFQEICSDSCRIVQKFGLTELKIDPLGSPIIFTLDKEFDHIQDIRIDARSLLTPSATIIVTDIPPAGGIPDQKIDTVIKVANAILGSSELEKIVEYQNGASDFEFTLPLEATETIPIGSWFEIRKTGIGDITIKKEGAQIFRSSLGDVELKLKNEDGFSVVVIKTDTDSWLLQGNVQVI